MQHFSNINKSFISCLICIIVKMNPLTRCAFFIFNKMMICVKVNHPLLLRGEGRGREQERAWEEWDLERGLRWFVTILIQSCNEAYAVVQEVIGLKWYFVWPCGSGDWNLFLVLCNPVSPPPCLPVSLTETSTCNPLPLICLLLPLQVLRIPFSNNTNVTQQYESVLRMRYKTEAEFLMVFWRRSLNIAGDTST